MQLDGATVRVIGVVGTVSLVGGVLVADGVPVGAATFSVTNLNDAGPGSLRQAIIDANTTPGVDVIAFDPALTGTIVLTSGQLGVADSVTITGPGAGVIAVSGNNTSRVFYLYNGTATLEVTISGLTVTGGSASSGGGIINRDEQLVLDEVVIEQNTASGDGGGLWSDGFLSSVVIRDSVITGNTAGDDGGGLYSEDLGANGFTIERTVISNNSAAGNGGGIAMYDPDSTVLITDSVISGNTAGASGGGMYVYDTDGGGIVIERTTISGNSAVGNGGGLALYGPDDPVRIVQSTISGNNAGGRGGGVFDESTISLRIEHSTIAANTAGVSGGGVTDLGGAAPLLDHTIVADNAAPAGPDLDGAFDGDFALVESTAGGTLVGPGNVTGEAPGLLPLADDGGFGNTHRLAASSPAIDAGDPGLVTSLTSDQRGAQRIVGAAIDIGAVESDPGTVAIDPTSVSVAENGGSVTITVTRTGTGDGAAEVDVVTANGTAVAGSDYTATTATVSWVDGETGAKTVTVPVLTDTVNPEPAETFTVALANPVGVSISDATPSVAVTITNVVPPTTSTTTTTTVAPTTTTAPGRPPAISAIEAQTLGWRTTTSLRFSVTDPDGDPVTVSVSATRPELFTQLTVGPSTSGIAGAYSVRITTAAISGTAQVTVTVTDGRNTTTEVFTVSVVQEAIPPTGAPPSSGPIAAMAALFVALGAAITRIARRRA